MEVNSFTAPFYSLTKKWFANLNINISHVSAPRYETQNFWLTADFKIHNSSSTKVLGARQGRNSNSKRDIANKCDKLISIADSGDSDVLNSALIASLKNHSLLELRNKKIPLESYDFSCYITCNSCNGSGDHRCNSCSGSGQVSETYQAHVGSSRTHTGNGGYYDTPMYELRTRYVSCNSCRGSGRVTCQTCSGCGENTFVKTLSFYSKSRNITRGWDSFKALVWVGSGIKENKFFDIDSAVLWDDSKQKIVGEKGRYEVTLPGTLQAGECKLKAESSKAATSGLGKTLGGMVFDTDYLFDSHYRWSEAGKENPSLEVRDVFYLTSSKLASVCVEDKGETADEKDELSSLNIITDRTKLSLKTLLDKLYQKHTKERERLPILQFLVCCAISGLLVFSPVLISKFSLGVALFEGFEYTSEFGFLPMIYNAIYCIKYVFSEWIGQAYGEVNHEVFIYLILVFIATTTLRYIVGDNTVATVSKFLKWFVFSGLFLCSYLLQFSDKIETPPLLIAYNPYIDYSIIAVFIGVLWAKKINYRSNKKKAKKYHFNKLLVLLKYKEG